MPTTSPNFDSDLNDLVGNTPGWLLKSGLSTLALVVCCVLLMAYFIKYPDKVNSTGIMTSANPPIAHKSLINGLVDTIFVEQNSAVSTGDTILYLKATAELADVRKLFQFIKKAKQVKKVGEYGSLSFPSSLQVGGLQPSYVELELVFQELHHLVNSKDVDQQIAALEQEIKTVAHSKSILASRKALSDDELQLVEKDFGKTLYLYNQNLISELELDQAKAVLLKNRQQNLNVEHDITENRLREKQLQSRIVELTEKRNSTLANQQFQLNKALNALSGKIDEWCLEHLVTAQIDGQLTLSSDLTRYRQVMADEVVAYILPSLSKSNRFIRAMVPGIGIGKIEVGNPVSIKVDGFPHKEFGTIPGYIESISLLPKKDEDGNQVYEIIVPLPNEILKTNYDKSVPFKPNTAVQLDVITARKSVLGRVFQQFINILNPGV